MTLLHPEKAAKATLIAQIGAFVAAVLAVTLWVVPVPSPSAPEIEPPPVQPAKAAQGKKDTTPPRNTDWTTLAPILSWATPAVAIAPNPGSATTEPGGPGRPEGAPTPDQAATAAALPNWRYVGYLREVDSFVALMSVDGKQRFVAPGQQVNGFTVETVDASFVQVRSGGALHRVSLSPLPTGDPRLTTPTFRQPAPRPPRAVRPPGTRDPRTDPKSAADRDRAMERIRENAGESPPQ